HQRQARRAARAGERPRQLRQVHRIVGGRLARGLPQPVRPAGDHHHGPGGAGGRHLQGVGGGRHGSAGLRRQRVVREREQPRKPAGPGNSQEPAQRELAAETGTRPVLGAGTRKKVIRMHPARKPSWQQATALVSLSTCGAMTGFAFAHGTVDDMTSPTRMPVKLMSLDQPAKAAKAAKAATPMSASESALRSAIVKVANYYLRMAQSKSPAEMEAMIWTKNSVDGANHGQSGAACASLTLALGAQATGQQSWVTGGTTYPWPLRQWADVRVDPNPDSPQITSIVQDAQAHHRWHPIGDGYVPQPG